MRYTLFISNLIIVTENINHVIIKDLEVLLNKKTLNSLNFKKKLKNLS
jgi:hypothetical protein